MNPLPEESPLYPLLPLKEDGEPADIIILTTDQWDEFRSERRADRRTRLVLVVLLALAVAAGIYGAWNAREEQKERKEAEVARRAVGEANQIILRNIQEQTSPERQAEQQAAVQQIVLTVDCNNRKVTEEALNAIARQRPDLFDRITLTDNCPKETP